MSYSLNSFGRLEKPMVYLSDPNKNQIGIIQARDLNSGMCFNDISEVSFKVYKYEDGIETENYDLIEYKRLVEVTSLGWFQVTTCDKIASGSKNEYKDIVVSALQREAVTKTLTSFGQLGIEGDEQGGLDRYALFNVSDVEHSILHIWVNELPAWKIGYVDPDITTEYRAFNNDIVGAYSFLVDDVSNTFECIFQFDTYNQLINVYKLENIGVSTSIYLSYRNLVKSIKQTADEDSIRTVYTVSGGDDNGYPMNINEVNVSGTSEIMDFSYYKHWMSEALQNRLDEYENEYSVREPLFTSAITTLQSYYSELNELYNKVPELPNSVIWSEYGLVELNAKQDEYNGTMAVYIERKLTSDIGYSNALYLYNQVTNEIKVRESQIDAKELQIQNMYTYCQSLVLNIRTFLGEELYVELSRYIHRDTFTDDTFVATDIMDMSKVIQMKKDLRDLAKADLHKKARPQYQVEIDSVNFLAIPEFKEYADQLELGNMITVDFGNDIVIELRLLKIDINWENKDDFTLTFGSKTRLDGVLEQLAEAQAQADSVSSSFGISGGGWNNAKNKTSEFNEYMTSTLNMARQKLINASNETFTIDTTGTKWRKIVDGTSDYSPNQMWAIANGIYMTRDSWQSVSLAIGEGTYNGQSVYGIWADLICGSLIVGETLIISNSAGNFTINNSGLRATYGTNVVAINPSNATEIFSIWVGGSKKLYIDVVSSRLVFNGTLEAANGSFSGVLSGATGTFSGTLSAGTIIGGTISGTNISGNTISGGTITGTTISGSTFTTMAYLSSGYYLLTELSGGSVKTSSISIVPVNTSPSFPSNPPEHIEILSTGINIFYNYERTAHIRSDGIIVCQRVDCSGVVNAGSLSVSGSLSVGNFSATSITNGEYMYLNGQTVRATANQLSLNGFPIITSFNKDNYTFPPESHSHTIYSSSIIPVQTGGGNIAFSGLNGASVNWCNDTFQPKTSSDFRLKKDFKPLSDLPIELFMELKPYMYTFKEETNGIGIHFGFFAQQIENLFKKYGFNPFDYNIIELRKPRHYTNEGLYLSDGFIHAINYNNFIAWDIEITQLLYKEVNILKLDLNKTKIEIEEIKKVVKIS